MDTPLNFTTVSAPLNRALQAAFDQGAGRLVPERRADGLTAVADLLRAAGQEMPDAPSSAVLGEWACGYNALDDAMAAAFSMGADQANMDTGLWFAQSVEQVLKDTGAPTPKPRMPVGRDRRP